jgi:molybdenum cofactor cytidylyltransferase
MGTPKQLMQFQGASLLHRAVHTALLTHFPVMVITGAFSEKVRGELSGEPVTIIENVSWQEGIASSLHCAIRHCPDETEALLVMTVDQPLVTPDLLERIVGMYEPTEVSLVACRYAGTVGVPALYDRSLFPDVLGLVGDVGAKPIIQRHAARARFIEAPECAFDIDRPEDAGNG